MKCIILGAGSGLPHPDYNLSGLVIMTTDGNFLVDCGEGIAKQLLINGFNKDYLDAILISHNHPDHITGIYMLLQMLYLEGRTKPLNLFLPERPADWLETLHMFYTFEQRLSYELKLHETKDIELFYDNISAALTDHLVNYADFVVKHQYPNLLQSYCFSFQEEGKSMVITSDINTFLNLRPLLDGADLIIMDGLHPNAELIINFADSFPGRLILTHGISFGLQDWLNNTVHPRVEIARENITYSL